MSAPYILALMSFCFLFFGYLGVPVPFSLMAGVFIGASLTDVSLAAIVQKIFDGMDSEALLAIPFFLLVGELMSSANVVVRIANLSLSLVGHIRGGLSQVVVVFSMFFSEMSGSTTADVAVMSRALAGPMRREGYESAFIAAIIAAASTIAALVPPSITAVRIAIADAGAILIVGPAQEKDFFAKFLADRHPEIRTHVEGVEKADHPTDGELVDHARRFVKAADRMRPQT